MGNFLVQQIRMASTNYLYTQAYAWPREQLETIARPALQRHRVRVDDHHEVGDVTFTLADRGRRTTPRPPA